MWDPYINSRLDLQHVLESVISELIFLAVSDQSLNNVLVNLDLDIGTGAADTGLSLLLDLLLDLSFSVLLVGIRDKSCCP